MSDKENVRNRKMTEIESVRVKTDRKCQKMIPRNNQNVKKLSETKFSVDNRK